MKRVTKSIPVISLTIALILITPLFAYACDMDAGVNYWYQLEYEIPVTSMPPDVEATVIRPPYSRISYKATATILGEIVLKNKGDQPVYIVPNKVIYELENFRQSSTPYAQEAVTLAEQLGQDEEITPSSYEFIFADQMIAANGTFTYSTNYDMSYLMYNPQSPGGVEPPPDPFILELMLISDNQLYTVPISVTYSISPFYDENIVVLAAPVSDYIIVTDSVILGTVIGAGENSSLQDEGYENQVFGKARIQVEEWLLGDGPDVIEVGYFGSPSAHCTISTTLAQKAYFLLQSPENSQSDYYSLTDNIDGARTVLPFTQDNYELVADALLKIKGVTMNPLYWLNLPIWRVSPKLF